MNRRAFLLAGLLSSTALVSAEAQPALTVIYVGGWDCVPCTRWKNAYKARWLASPEYKQVRWIEVESPNFREAYQVRFWPDELRPILDQLPIKNVTPRFLVVRNGRIIDNRFGGNSWPIIMADVRKYVG